MTHIYRLKNLPPPFTLYPFTTTHNLNWMEGVCCKKMRPKILHSTRSVFLRNVVVSLISFFGRCHQHTVLHSVLKIQASPVLTNYSTYKPGYSLYPNYGVKIVSNLTNNSSKAEIHKTEFVKCGCKCMLYTVDEQLRAGERN